MSDELMNRARDLLAEVERLSSGSICELAASNPSVAEYCRHWESRAEAAEARYKELCEAEPVAIVDREAVGRVFWLSIIPDGTLLIRRPSMEKNNG